MSAQNNKMNNPLRIIGSYHVYNVGTLPGHANIKIGCLVSIIPPIVPNPKFGGHDVIVGFGETAILAQTDAVDRAEKQIRSNMQFPSQ